jgi:sulfoxide reductase heme-binding subunit YedZ
MPPALKTFLTPWRDPAGKFSALKAATLLLVLYPAVMVALRGWFHDLGGRPITEATHITGDWTVRFLMLSLAVTPARAVLNWPRVIILRRLLGVSAALYAGLHLGIYIYDQNFNPFVVVSEIVLRVYLLIGFTALCGLAALAVTSTDGWQRRLRARWKRLHRLVFPAAVLGLLHYYMQSKANVGDAVFYSGVFFWLMLWRALPRAWQARALSLPALALGAAVLTALAEALWYGLATRLSGWRVLEANFGPDPRPAALVLLAGAAVLVVALLRRLRKPARPRLA